MPNSPVVINGNGYNFKGFIVAERFLKLKAAEDFPQKAVGGTKIKTDDRGNEYYIDSDGNILYHKAAEGGTRYIQKLKVGGKIKSGNVIYATGTYTEVDLNDVSEKATNIYEVYDEITHKTKYVEINSGILYTYTLIEQEKSNLISTYKDSEKEYVKVYPMYIDQFGNVQYRPLNDSDNYKSDKLPMPLDSEWHAGEEAEIIYNPETFGLASATYSSYNKVSQVDYTKLNDPDRKINDVFYRTIRSDWID